MQFNSIQYEIYKDQFNIYNIITKTDKNYRLVFDKINKRFAIINIAKNCQICLNFDNFCQNIENFVKFTRVENSKKLFNFIDEENQNKLTNKHKKLMNETTDKLLDLTKTLNKTHSNLDNKLKKLIEDNYA